MFRRDECHESVARRPRSHPVRAGARCPRFCRRRCRDGVLAGEQHLPDWRRRLSRRPGDLRLRNAGRSARRLLALQYPYPRDQARACRGPADLRGHPRHSRRAYGGTHHRRPLLLRQGALGAACRVHARSAIETTWLDSVRVAKRAWPQLSSHRLNVLSHYLGISHKHHDALSDARAAGVVVVRAMEETGIDLAGWLTPAASRSGPAPRPAADGPLTGHRIAILGAARDGTLGCMLAQAGARVVASVGTTTTILVVASDQPFGRFAHASPAYRRADELRRNGSPIEIVDEESLRHRIGAPSAGSSRASAKA